MTHQTPTTPTDAPAFQAPRVPQAELHLPDPPVETPRADRGQAQASAVQHAERDVATGLDAPAVEAGQGVLPYERERLRELAVEEHAIDERTESARGVADALIVDAVAGTFTPRPAELRNGSQRGAAAEADMITEAMVTATEQHDQTEEVLAGTRDDEAGCRRPGKRIAAGESSPKALRRSLRLHSVLEWLPVIVLLLLEGVAVANNMRAYLRSNDADFFGPLVIAVITVGIITVVPFFLGRALNDAARGRSLNRWEWCGAGIAAAFWISTGVLLAVVRVQVDRADAITKAQEAEYDRVAMLSSLNGETVQPTPIDPALVFDPLVPSLFWGTVFIGFGAAMILVEIFTRNPARIAELEARIAVISFRERLLESVEYRANLDEQVGLQRTLATVSAQMWAHERLLAGAAAQHDIAIWQHALAQAAGDPAMVLAIEQRLAARPTSVPTSAPQPSTPGGLPSVAAVELSEAEPETAEVRS